MKKIIRRIVFQPDDFDRRVVECDPAAAAEGLDALLVEFPAAGHQEMRLVARGKVAHDPPHVVLQVRVEEIHRPADTLRRKAAEHQHPGMRRQEGFKRMFLGCHFVVN